MNRPIIFLDMDGVLNDHKQASNGFCGVKPECVCSFNRILRETNARIVISSAWRYMVPDAMTVKGFEYLLLTHGVDCQDRVIGVTCRDEELMPRGQQIRHWRNENGGKAPYVVLDDLDPGITDAGHPFIQTNGAIGLTCRDADRVIAILTEVRK